METIEYTDEQVKAASNAVAEARPLKQLTDDAVKHGFIRGLNAAREILLDHASTYTDKGCGSLANPLIIASITIREAVEAAQKVGE